VINRTLFVLLSEPLLTHKYTLCGVVPVLVHIAELCNDGALLSLASTGTETNFVFESKSELLFESDKITPLGTLLLNPNLPVILTIDFGGTVA
jgi:hypothetical protein